MKTKSFVVFFLIFSLVLTAGAFAAGMSDTMSSSMSGNSIKASDLMNKQINDQAGEKVGKINDLVFDSNTGRLAFVVMQADSSIISGDKNLVAIPWKALTPSATGDTYALNVSKDKLKNAPSFAKSSWPNINDRAWLTDVYKFYGLQPSFEENMPSGTMHETAPGGMEHPGSNY
jgi:sporulation protein YlmC with PRC-barrel domain